MYESLHKCSICGLLKQSVTHRTADSGVASLILARLYTFVETDYEIICNVNSPPSADSRRVVVSYKRKYVHKVLVNHFVKHAKKKG